MATLRALVLAGGRGSRLGHGPKWQQPLGGKPLLQHVLAAVQPQVDEVLLSAPDACGTGLTFLPDRVGGPAGPAAGLHAACAHLAGTDTDRLLVVPVDTPFLPRDLLQQLAARPGCRVASLGERWHPSIALWPLDQLTAALGGEGTDQRGPSLHALAQDCGATPVLLPARCLHNINTPADLAAAEALLAD